jgi:hypothetical protein
MKFNKYKNEICFLNIYLYIFLIINSIKHIECILQCFHSNIITSKNKFNINKKKYFHLSNRFIDGDRLTSLSTNSRRYKSSKYPSLTIDTFDNILESFVPWTLRIKIYFNCSLCISTTYRNIISCFSTFSLINSKSFFHLEKPNTHDVDNKWKRKHCTNETLMSFFFKQE